MLLVLFAAAAAVHSGPAHFMNVQIGSASVRVPFPRGYCKPTGKAAAATQLLAAADNRNITLLTLVRCGADGPPSDYLIIKSPIEALNEQIDRSAFIERMSKQIEGPAFGARIGSFTDSAANRLSEVAGTAVKLDVSVGPRGHDDTCVYVAGNGTDSVAGKSFPKAIGMCITTIASKPVSLNAYKLSAETDAFLPLLPFLKRWALQMEPSPSNGP